MNEQQKNLTVDEIDQGKALLQVNRELAKIIKDIADPNKAPTKSREVVLKITFTPNLARSAAKVKYAISSKPAPYVETDASDVYMGMDGTKPIARPWVPNQQALFKEKQAEVAQTEAAE